MNLLRDARLRFTTDYKLISTVYVVLITGLSLVFQHADLISAGQLAWGILDGHFFDFYEYGESALLPSIAPNEIPQTMAMYSLLAVWSYPLKLLSIVNDPVQEPFVFVFWLKSLTLLFTAGTAVLLYRIAHTVLMLRDAHAVVFIWLTSPLLIYTQILYGGYDIFPLFFAVAALSYYLRRRLAWFAILMGIAISFKGYYGVMFIPLLLLVEKDLRKLIPLIILALIPAALVTVPWLQDSAFLDQQGRVRSIFVSHIQLGLRSSLSIFWLAFFLLCGSAFITRISTSNLTGGGIYQDLLCDSELANPVCFLGLVTTVFRRARSVPVAAGLRT